MSRFALTGKGDKIDRWEPASSVPRNRYSDDRSPRAAQTSSGTDHRGNRWDRSRGDRWSPERDERYSRRRPSPQRNHDRYSAAANSGAPRPSYPGPRKEPSVHDANTRADLGRLAREAEAAAYKARTLALAKSQNNNSSSQSSASPRHSQAASNRSDQPATESRKRSRSPRSRRSSDSRPNPSARSNSGPVTDSRTPVLVREKSSLLSPKHNKNPAEISRQPTLTKKALTAADIGRLEREKEAAAYKAKVLQESQKTQVMSHSQTKDSKQTVSIATTTEKPSTHSSSNTKSQQAVSPEKPLDTEVVQQIISITPTLDSQVTTQNIFDHFL